MGHQVAQSSSKFQEQQIAQSIHELKKNDLFDLGVLLTICATDGIDMVNEEYVAQLQKLNQECCLVHAIKRVDTSQKGFDKSLKSTLLVMRRILGRISDRAADFICQLMQ